MKCVRPATGSRRFRLHEDVDITAAARMIAASFPLLHGHYSDCMPEPVDVAEATADDLTSSRTFYVKW